jgi:hypothetical protein
MRTNRQCTLVCVAVGCVLLMALCIWLMVYADGSERGAWLLGLLLPCIVVVCCAFAVLSYTMVHLICPVEEEEEEEDGGREMETTNNDGDDDESLLIAPPPVSRDFEEEAQNI